MYLHLQCYSPFPSGTSLLHPSSPCFYEGALPPTHSHLTALAFPYNGPSSLHRIKSFSFPMPDKAILCYICGWRHGSLHGYYLFGGLVPGSSGLWLVDIVVLPVGLQTPSVLPLAPALEVPMLSPMVGCEHLHLHLSGSGRQAISGSCQQVLLGICNSVWVWCLYMG